MDASLARELEGLGASALGRILSVGVLASGANNEILAVRGERGEAVLKRTRPGGVRRLETERRALALADGRFAPRLLGFRPGHAGEPDRLLQERAPGCHRESLSRAAAVALGEALTTLRERPSDGSGLPRPSWGDHVRDRLLAQYRVAARAAPSRLLARVERQIEAVSARCAGLSEERPDRAFGLVHGDVIPLNVLFDGDRPVLVDWELARVDRPEWDPVSVAKSFRFEPGAHEAFREALGPLEPERELIVGLLHHANVALWRLVSFHAHGQYREIATRFLQELDEELDWVDRHL